MKLLIFDTETTGLPKSRKPSSEGPNNWPHIVSISWVILDSETNEIQKERYYVIKPQGWTIPEEAIRIHKITNEIAERDGVSLSTTMGEFLAETYDALVAHNIEFDYNVLDNAIRWDLSMAFNEIRKPKLCTMELSRNICNMRTLFGKPKAPKLSELYTHVFGTAPDMDTLHNSLVDTKLLVKIVQECKPLRVKMNLTEGEQYVAIQNARQKTNSGVLSIRLG